MSWKLLAIGLALAGGFWAWRKRGAQPASPGTADIRIVKRTSVGVRSELLLIEVQGQKLLVGVTPHTIQNLFIVPEDAIDEELAVDTEASPLVYARRLAGVIETGEPARAARAPKPNGAVLQATPATPADVRTAPVEEQARGLLAIGGRQ